MGAFKARFAGVCAAKCGDTIQPGDRIVMVNDRAVHEGCEQVARTIAAQDDRPVCGTCFLLKPCPCDDGQGPVAA
jgi:hypothetical protein